MVHVLGRILFRDTARKFLADTYKLAVPTCSTAPPGYTSTSANKLVTGMAYQAFYYYQSMP